MSRALTAVTIAGAFVLGAMAGTRAGEKRATHTTLVLDALRRRDRPVSVETLAVATALTQDQVRSVLERSAQVTSDGPGARYYRMAVTL